MDNTPSPAPVTHVQFMAAAAGNDVATLRRYLAQGGNIDLTDAAGESALVVATRAGHEAFVLELLDASAKFALDWKGSALGIAIQNGHEHLAPHLYRAASARRASVSRDTMHDAITKDDLHVVRRYLAQLKQSAPVEPIEDHLLTACGWGRHAIAALLLSDGADPHPFSFRAGTTPLSEAAARGDTRMIKLLLEYPTANIPLLLEPDKQTPRRAVMPLAAAASHYRPEAVAQLLAAGANPVDALIPVLQAADARLPDPQVALATLVLLLDRMEQPEIDAAHAAAGHSLLHLACQANAWWSVDALLDRGMPVDLPGAPTGYGGRGTTPFLAACVCGSVNTMRRLAAHGANIEQKNDDGNGAMTLALLAFVCAEMSQEKLEEVFACLLELGCDPDIPDGDGQSPRLRAAHHPELVQMMDATAARNAILGAVGRASAARTSVPA